MEIRILGTGCPKCNELYRETREAAAELSLDCNIEKVSDIQDIMSYGVMMTPALVVDGEVKAAGKVPSREDIKKLLG